MSYELFWKLFLCPTNYKPNCKKNDLKVGDNYQGLQSCAISLPSHYIEMAFICPAVVLY